MLKPSVQLMLLAARFSFPTPGKFHLVFPGMQLGSFVETPGSVCVGVALEQLSCP